MKTNPRIGARLRGLTLHAFCPTGPGLIATSAERETVVAGRYRVAEVRMVPEPGTNLADGYTIPQYVLTENVVAVLNARRRPKPKRGPKATVSRRGVAKVRNPLKIDPTRTAGIRRAFLAEFRRRFGRLKADLIKLVADEDAFGLEKRPAMVGNERLQGGPGDWVTPSELKQRVANMVAGRGVDNSNPEGCNQHTGPGCGGGSGPETVGAKRLKDMPEVGATGSETARGGYYRVDSLSGMEIADSETINRINGLADGARSYGLEEVDPSELISTQDVVEADTLRGIVASGTVRMDSVVKVFEDSDGTRYLLDGHTRAVGAEVLEQGAITARIFKADEDDDGPTDNRRRTVTANAGRWASQSNARQLQAFRAWLRTQVQSRVLSERQALDRYIQEGYRKGAGRAFDDVRQADLRQRRPELFTPERQDELRPFYRGSREEFLRSSFGRPVAREKVELLAARSYSDLEGVTEAMSTAMSRTLTDGLVQGKSPRDVAKDLAKDVDGIGLARANVIARTEIIRAHSEGQLTAMEDLGVTEVGVMVEWLTAGDEKVCAACEPLEGAVLSIDEARGMLPRHPNCRCCWIPANVGEDKEDQTRSKGDLERAVKDSLEAGQESEGEEGGAWGPGIEISMGRPESVLNANPDGCNQHTGPGCGIGSSRGASIGQGAESKVVLAVDLAIEDEGGDETAVELLKNPATGAEGVRRWASQLRGGVLKGLVVKGDVYLWDDDNVHHSAVVRGLEIGRLGAGHRFSVAKTGDVVVAEAGGGQGGDSLDPEVAGWLRGGGITVNLEISMGRPESVLNALDAFSRFAVANAFCPTGEGGGVDPSCSPGGGGQGEGGGAKSPRESTTDEIHERAKSDPNLSYQDIAEHVESLRPLSKARLKEVAISVGVHSTSGTSKEELLRGIRDSLENRKGRTHRTTVD